VIVRLEVVCLTSEDEAFTKRLGRRTAGLTHLDGRPSGVGSLPDGISVFATCITRICRSSGVQRIYQLILFYFSLT